MESVEYRIKLFEAVRDLPYQIGSADTDASCYAKTKLLGELLVRSGLKCRIARVRFSWKDLGIPDRLLSITSRPKSWHYFLKLYIPERKRWVCVDPTWDSSLPKQFINNSWDGLSDTALAVKGYQEELVKKDGRFITPFEFPFRDFDLKDTFTRHLNDWYQSQRRKV